MERDCLRQARRTEAVKAYCFHINVLKAAFHALENDNVPAGANYTIALMKPAVHKFVTDCPRKKTKSKELGNALFMLMTGSVNLHHIDRVGKNRGSKADDKDEPFLEEQRRNNALEGAGDEMLEKVAQLGNRLMDLSKTDAELWFIFQDEWPDFKPVRLDSKGKLVSKLEKLWFFLCNDLRDSDVTEDDDLETAGARQLLSKPSADGSLKEALVRVSVWDEFETKHYAYQLFNNKQLKCMLEDLDDEQEVEFLRSLCLVINDEDWMGHRKFMHTPEVDVVHGRFSHATYLEEEDTIGEDHPLAQLTKGSGEHTCMVHYTCAGQLFFEQQRPCVQDEGLLHGLGELVWPETKGSHRELANVMWFLDYLSRPSAPPGVFATPIVQGVVRFHWQQVYWTFIRDRVIDVVTLFLMWRLVTAVHDKQRPSLWIFWCLFVSAVYSMGKVVINIIMSTYIFGKYGLKHMASTWNVVATFFDLYGFAVTLYALVENYAYSEGKKFGETFCGRHEVLIFFLVATKWLYCLLQVMNLEKIGQNILPVWEAVKCEESYTFLAYLSVATAGMTMSYFAFSSDGESIVEAFIRTFRLFWLADMDIYELDGQDGTIDLNSTAITTMYKWLRAGTWENQSFDDDQFTVGTNGDGNLSKRDKNGMRFFMVVSVFLGTVMFMNVYIALLGNKYDDVKAEITERFTQFRLQCVKSMMLRCHMFLMIRSAWKVVEQVHDSHECSGDKNRLFVRMPDSACQPDDVDPENSGLATKQDATDIKQTLSALEEKLAKLLQQKDQDNACREMPSHWTS